MEALKGRGRQEDEEKRGLLQAGPLPRGTAGGLEGSCSLVLLRDPEGPAGGSILREADDNRLGMKSWLKVGFAQFLCFEFIYLSLLSLCP